MDWITRRLSWPSLALLVLMNGGCLAPGTHTPGEPVAAVVLPGDPVPAPAAPEVAGTLPDNEPMTWRAVSSEPEASADIGAYPLPDNVAVPGALEICPLNSVLKLANGDNSPQTREDAFKTLGLFGLTGAVHLLRHAGGSGGDHGLHRVGDFTDDLLQPDDESAATKRVRPPFAFGLEWHY